MSKTSSNSGNKTPTLIKAMEPNKTPTLIKAVEPNKQQTLNKTTEPSKQQTLNTTMVPNKRPATNKPKPFVSKTDKCIMCGRAVYITEMAKADGKTFHKACQKCMECKRTLVIGNILIVSEKLFCKMHGTQEKNVLLKKRLDLD